MMLMFTNTRPVSSHSQCPWVLGVGRWWLCCKAFHSGAAGTWHSLLVHGTCPPQLRLSSKTSSEVYLIVWFVVMWLHLDLTQRKSWMLRRSLAQVLNGKETNRKTPNEILWALPWFGTSVMSYLALLSAFSLVITSAEKKNSSVPTSSHPHGTDK